MKENSKNWEVVIFAHFGVRIRLRDEIRFFDEKFAVRLGYSMFLAVHFTGVCQTYNMKSA